MSTTSSLSVLHNYFDDPIKLFLDFHLAKFLNTSIKPFFPCIIFAIVFIYLTLRLYLLKYTIVVFDFIFDFVSSSSSIKSLYSASFPSSAFSPRFFEVFVQEFALQRRNEAAATPSSPLSYFFHPHFRLPSVASRR